MKRDLRAGISIEDLRAQEAAEMRRRKERLAIGCCPTHNVGLVQDGVVFEDGEPVAAIVRCPRGDCHGRGEQDEEGVVYFWTEEQTGLFPEKGAR